MSGILCILIVNKSGGLVYSFEGNCATFEYTNNYNFPLTFHFKERDDKYQLAFGETSEVKVGMTLSKINGKFVSTGSRLGGCSVLEYLAQPTNYPLSLTFAKGRPSTNEKIMLASMFHSMHAISIQLAPVPHSSGIQKLQSHSFVLHCRQTLTGIKFVIITSPNSATNVENSFRRLYQIYADYALKNPFQPLEMPIRSESFDLKISAMVEKSASE